MSSAWPRARTRLRETPLLVIFGADDRIWNDPGAAAAVYRGVPGARIATIPGAGNSPNVEKPGRTARLILRFTGAANRRS